MSSGLLLIHLVRLMSYTPKKICFLSYYGAFKKKKSKICDGYQLRLKRVLQGPGLSLSVVYQRKECAVYELLRKDKFDRDEIV